MKDQKNKKIFKTNRHHYFHMIINLGLQTVLKINIEQL